MNLLAEEIERTQNTLPMETIIELAIISAICLPEVVLNFGCKGPGGWKRVDIFSVENGKLIHDTDSMYGNELDLNKARFQWSKGTGPKNVNFYTDENSISIPVTKKSFNFIKTLCDVIIKANKKG